MSINILTPDGLQEIGKVTKNKVISALGKDPIKEIEELNAELSAHEATNSHISATERTKWNNPLYSDLKDAPNIVETDTGDLVIADEAGNIIARVDADGITTYGVTASNIKLGSTDLKKKLDEIEAELASVGSNLISSITEDESGKLSITDPDGNIIMEVDDTGVKTATVAARFVNVSEEIITKKIKLNETDLETTLSGQKSLIETNKRNIEELNANLAAHLSEVPDIVEDNSGVLDIADPDGNIIAKIDGDGLKTANIEARNIKLSADFEASKIKATTELEAASIKLAGADLSQTLASHTGLIGANKTGIQDTAAALAAHAADTEAHFSGKFQDLKENPFKEDDSEKLIVADEDGNIIFEINSDGKGSTNVYSLQINNEPFSPSTINTNIINISRRVGDNEANISAINSKLDDLLYEEIAISSFSNNAGTKERGQTVTDVTLSWTTNKTPSTLKLDGTALSASTTSKVLSGLSITWDNNKTWTLEATDDRNAKASKTTSITFANRVCYGVAAAPATINSSFVMGLATKTLTNSKANNSISFNAGSGQYIWYCVPTRLGTCSFTDVETGLGAGLALVDTVSVTNASNYTENYYVYRSDFAALGSVKIKVS